MRAKDKLRRLSNLTPEQNTKELRAAWQFFLGAAGYCTPPGRAACALHLAKAEAVAEDYGFRYEWGDDDGPDLGDHEYWCELARTGQQHEHHVKTCCVKSSQGEQLASLCGIIDPDRDYRRVVEAELTVEALQSYEPKPKQERPSAERILEALEWYANGNEDNGAMARAALGRSPESVGESVCKALAARGYPATWEYPGYLSISLDDGSSWAFGTANPQWAGAVTGDKNGEERHLVEFDIDSKAGFEAVPAIVDAITNAVDEYTADTGAEVLEREAV